MRRGLVVGAVAVVAMAVVVGRAVLLLDRGWRLSWACDPCLLMDGADRAIGLQSQVIVAEGDLPNWDIHMALGR